MQAQLISRPGALFCLLALLCSASGTAYAQDEQAMKILSAMSSEVASLDAFVITGDGYIDARLDAGQIIEHSADVTARVSRPDAMRITNRDAETTMEIYYGDGVITVYNEARNFYAQHEAPEGVNAAVSFAVNELNIEAPVLDFISNDVGKLLTEDAESVTYLGESRFRGDLYDHIGIRTDEVDIQVWVAAEGPPLPGKLAISAKWEGGAPRSVFFFDWDTNPEFDRQSFGFRPPADATRIEFDLGQ